MSWQVPAVVLGLAVLLAAAAYFGYMAATELRPEYGGRYVEGIAGSPAALNPLVSQFNDTDKDIVSLVFAGLTRLAPSGEIVPDMAERWDINDGGKTYVFHLREGLKWHDGVPLNADDVVFTIKMVQAKDYPGSPDLASLWKNVTVAKTDDLTIAFSLPQPFAPFLSYTTLGLVPFHLLRDLAPADLVRTPFNSQPVGSGPFRLTEAYVDRMILKANADYPLGRPFIGEIELRFLHDDQALMNALEEKRIDGALLRPVAPADRLERLKADGRLAVMTPLRTAFTAVFLNSGLPLFQDKTLRQALLTAVDREGLVREVLSGQGAVATGPIIPDTWAAVSDVKRYTYEPDKAAQMLDTAGWKMGPDGIRQKDGKDLRFTLVTNDDRTRMRVTEYLAADWKALGARVEVSALGPAGLIQNHLVPRRYEAVLYGLDTGYDPDAYPLWHSTQRGEDGLNIAGYSNKAVDSELELARQTTDRAARQKAYSDFQATFAEEVPALLLYYPQYSYIVDRKVQGIQVGPLYETGSRFYDVRNWYIQTKRELRR